MIKKINLAYAGTPDFSADILNSILKAGFNVSLVLTQADRRSGRGMKLHMNPVKKIAIEEGIPVLQPLSLNLNGSDPENALHAHNKLLSMKCDVLLVVAYGMILPSSMLSLPRYGCINVHASLLPRWRGAAPIQRAIEAGDSETGITMMLMDEGLDTGPILSQVALPIIPSDTSASLRIKLASLGSRCSIEMLKNLSMGKPLSSVPQNNNRATYALKITKKSSMINWTNSASFIDCFVRSLDPFPGAVSRIGGHMIKIWRVEIVDLPEWAIYPPGYIVKASAQDLIVSAKNSFLRILELQRPGGKRLRVDDFLSGLSLREGACFSS